MNPAEIKQIEVIRGPASAIWGANALSGVVNVITKTPREIQGSSFTIGFGGFDRESAERDAGRRLAVLRLGLARAGGQRALGVQGVGRCLHAGPAAAPDGRHAERHGHAVSGLHERRARRSRSSICGWTGTSRTASDAGVPGRRRRAPTASCTAGSGRSTSTAARCSATRKVNYSKNALQGELLHEHPRRQRHQPARRSVPTGSSSASTSRARRSTSKSGNVQNLGTHNVLTYGGNFRQNLFDLTIAPGRRQPRPRAAPTRRTRSSRQVRPLDRRRARGQVREHRAMRSSRRARAAAEAFGAADGARSRTTGRSARRR